MKKLYILCGLAFSGKSTLSKKIAEYKNAILVSQDVIWFEKKKEWNLDEDSDDDWARILEISKEKVRADLVAGKSVVFDDISLKRSERDNLRTLAAENGAEIVLIYLDTPKEIREARRNRNFETKERHPVQSHIIQWGIDQLEVPKEDEHPFIFKPEDDMDAWIEKLP